METKSLLSKPLPEWRSLFRDMGFPAYRADQTAHWIFKKYKDTFSGMPNLPKELRKALAERFHLHSLSEERRQVSADGTTKWALKTADGYLIECVLIPDGERRSLCVSSQVGCAMGCRFCNTAKMGFHRHLETGEILEQFLLVSRHLEAAGEKLTNVIFMGMGEPLHNLNAVASACETLAAPLGFGLPKRRITVSTSGLATEIRAWAERMPGVKLAVSLNGSDNASRGSLMPVNKRYPLEELLAAADEYGRATGERLTFEYVLIPGYTSSLDDAKRLRQLASTRNCKVNLIPFNAGAGGDFQSPSEEEVRAFTEELRKGRFPVMVRKPKGRDIAAACGQLVQQQRKVA